MAYLLANYVNKTSHVTALRLTEENMAEVADLIEADHCSSKAPSSKSNVSSIVLGGRAAYVGDWIVLKDPEEILVYEHEEFLMDYVSISEALSESDRLAAINEIVLGVMTAGRNGIPNSPGWETAAVLASQQIMKLV